MKGWSLITGGGSPEWVLKNGPWCLRVRWLSASGFIGMVECGPDMNRSSIHSTQIKESPDKASESLISWCSEEGRRLSSIAEASRSASSFTTVDRVSPGDGGT